MSLGNGAVSNSSDLVQLTRSSLIQYLADKGGNEAVLARADGASRILDGLGVGDEAMGSAYLAPIPNYWAGYGALKRETELSDAIKLADNFNQLNAIQLLSRHSSGYRKASERKAQLESIRKMFLAMITDLRVLIVKLAYQLQRLRDLTSSQNLDEQRQVARDTLDLFAPLANRLGIWSLKWELEDLSLRLLDPTEYKRIASNLDEKRRDRESYLEQYINLVRGELSENGLVSEVTGRPKHIYSIWRKLQNKNRQFSQLADIRGIRVVVESVAQCYSALGVIHARWAPVPGEFDDYIAKPKANDYQSLHTAVVGPEDKIVEIQIRTKQMHEHAELGVAAHWRYKEQKDSDNALDKKIVWLRRLLDWQGELANGLEVDRDFSEAIADETVFALTPQGRVLDLPVGSTAIDFAYAIHTDLGHRCRGAEINGRLKPLSRKLNNGDVVKIVSGKDKVPSRDWLNRDLGFVASSRARTKIRSWFNAQEREIGLEEGRREFEKSIHRLSLPISAQDAVREFSLSGIEELYLSYYRGDLTTGDLKNQFRKSEANQSGSMVDAQAAVPQSVGTNGVLVVGVDQLLTRLAKCCKPVRPEPIVGYVSKGRGVMVHRRSCPNLGALLKDRVIEASWGAPRSGETYQVDIEVLADSEEIQIRDVIEVFNQEKIKILSTRSSVGDRKLSAVVTIEIDSVDFIERAVGSVEKKIGVFSARRI